MRYKFPVGAVQKRAKGATAVFSPFFKDRKQGWVIATDQTKFLRE